LNSKGRSGDNVGCSVTQSPEEILTTLQKTKNVGTLLLILDELFLFTTVMPTTSAAATAAAAAATTAAPTSSSYLITQVTELIDAVLMYIVAHTPSAATITRDYLYSNAASDVAYLSPLVKKCVIVLSCSVADLSKGANSSNVTLFGDYDSLECVMNFVVRLLTLENVYLHAPSTPSPSPSPPATILSLLSNLDAATTNKFVVTILRDYVEQRTNADCGTGNCARLRRIRELYRDHKFLRTPPRARSGGAVFVVTETARDREDSAADAGGGVIRTVFEVGVNTIKLPYRIISFLLAPSSSTTAASTTTATTGDNDNSASVLTPPSGIVRVSNNSLIDGRINLLLLLCHLNRSWGRSNKYYDALSGIVDGPIQDGGGGDGDGGDTQDGTTHDDVEATPSSSSTLPLTLPFNSLYATLCKTIIDENVTLLLYTLINANPSYVNHLLSHVDLDLLTLPMLHNIYTATISRARRVNGHGYGYRCLKQLYVTMIILLHLTQDLSYSVFCFQLLLPSVKSYEEKNIKNINLGSYVYLVLFRIVTHNINYWNDEYLLDNSLAVLHNLSSFVKGIHGYTSERLCNFIVSTIKISNTNEFSLKAGKEGLIVIHNAFHGDRISTNIQLIYNVIYKASLLISAIESCEDICDGECYRLKCVLKVTEDWFVEDGISVENIIRILEMRINDIKKAVIEADAAYKKSKNNTTSNDIIESTEDAIYSYTEENDPGVFFVPYTFEITCENVFANFLSFEPHNKIKLFDVDMSRNGNNGSVRQDSSSAQVGNKDDGSKEDDNV
jgi:hypothetical protein